MSVWNICSADIPPKTLTAGLVMYEFVYVFHSIGSGSIVIMTRIEWLLQVSEGERK